MAKAPLDYALTSLDYLALTLNAQAVPRSYEKYHYTFVSITRGIAINIRVFLNQPMDEAELDALTENIDSIRDQTSKGIKEGMGWDDVNVKVSYEKSVYFHRHVERIKTDFEAIMKNAELPVPVWTAENENKEGKDETDWRAIKDVPTL